MPMLQPLHGAMTQGRNHLLVATITAGYRYKCYNDYSKQYIYAKIVIKGVMRHICYCYEAIHVLNDNVMFYTF